MAGLNAAFRKAGVRARNTRQSWSAKSDNGNTIVMTLWKDLLDYSSTPISYSSYHRDNPLWKDRWGNRERLENLRWARDHCGGVFRVIITTAKDTDVEPREVADAFYHERMIMKIKDLDEETGEFSAVNIGT
jgi:hypothetical protein